MEEIIEGTESFYLKGNNDKAVLLVHGYTGNTSQMKILGQYLNKEGYTVVAPLLPGHGTCVEDLQETKAKEWYECVENVYNEMHKDFEKIAVIGLSLGGLLAIRLAAEKKVWKLVSVASPIYFADKRLKWLWLLKHFMKYAEKRRHSYPVNDCFNVSYQGKIPVLPLESLLQLMHRCRHHYLGRILVPVLALHGGLDKTAKPESVEIITGHVRSKIKQSLTLQDSGHMVLLDKQRAFAEQQIVEFLNR